MAAIVNVCVDPRLEYDAIRRQVQARLERLHLPTDGVYITNDIGGNVRSSFRNTARLLREQREPIVLAAVLHHDDCIAARAGSREPLEKSAQDVQDFFAELGVRCPVLTGNLLTESSRLTWTDEPNQTFEVLRFRMPRMYGS